MKKQKQLKKFVLGAVIFAAVFVAGTVIKANVDENGLGWIWGGSEEINDGTINGNETGVGWISMNSANCDTNDDGNSEGGSGCPTAGTTIADYGVQIPTSNGQVTGYAWSGNDLGPLGYVDFNPHDGCPGSPRYAGACDAYPSSTIAGQDVRRSGNSFVGWARFVDISKEKANGNAGGYDGWVMFGGNPGSRDNVIIDPGSGKLYGYAWSGDLGYISFKGAIYGAFIPPPPDLTFMIDGIPSGSKIISTDTPFSWTNKTITLSWTATNGATGCTASSTNPALWAGGTKNASSAGDVVTLTAANHNGSFTLYCTGPGGNSLIETVGVTTGCSPKTCAGTTCGLGILVSNGDADNTKCTTLKPAPGGLAVCSTDSDCQPRSTGTWKEVAP